MKKERITCIKCSHVRYGENINLWWCDAPLPAWVIVARTASEWIRDPDLTGSLCKCFKKNKDFLKKP